MKKKRTLPKFGAGGEKFKKDFAEYAGNTGAGILDIAATTIGMPNVADNLYTGTSANQFQNVAGGIGQVSAAAAPIVANTFLPGSGTAIAAGQKGLGMVDGAIAKNNQAIDPQTGKPYTGTGDMIGKSVGGLGAGIAPMMMKNGGIMKYGDGGKASKTDFFNVAASNGKLDIKAGAEASGYKYKSGDWKNPNSLIFTKDDKDYIYAMGDKGNVTYGALELPAAKSTEVSFPKTGIIKQEEPWINMGTLPTGEGYFRKGNVRGADANIRYTYVNGQFVPMMANGGKVLPEAGITSVQRVYNNYKTKTNGMMVYNNGGMQPNAEVEKQENTLNPDGSTYQFDGPSHANGGIKTNLEQGTMVFSDKLKLPGTRKTFADLNKPNLTIKEDKMLAKTTNPTERLTAELMKMAKNKNSKSLFAQQESLKQNKLSNYAKRLGINSSSFQNGGIQKYPGGGTYVGPMDEGIEMPAKYDQRGGGDPTEYLNKPIFNEGSVWEDVYNKGLADNSKTPAITDSADPSKGFNWGTIGTQLGLGIANNLGNIYDLKRANDVENTTYNRVTPQKVDPTAALRYNDAQSRAFNEALRNSSVGNSSTYIQNRKDAGIQQMYANDQIRQQYANTNAQIQNQANYYNAGIGDKEFDANAMNRSKARDIKSNAYANIGQNIMGQTKDYKMDNLDKDKLKILAQYYNDPTFQKMLKEYTT